MVKRLHIKFIDSFRLMSSSLSSPVDNLSDGFHCDKSIECKSYLDCLISKDDQLIFRCFEYYKNYKKDFNKDLLKDLQIHTNFVMKTLINLFCY